MKEIMEEFAEYICDKVCGNLDDVPAEQVESICEQCKLDYFINRVLNKENNNDDIKRFD